jgi:ABC-type glycerol-3-phosphate transport system permease component
MLPLAGEAFAYRKEALSSLIVSALIMVPQVIVAMMAPWTGRRVNMWGRRPLLLVGFGSLCKFQVRTVPIARLYIPARSRRRAATLRMRALRIFLIGDPHVALLDLPNQSFRVELPET